MPVTKSAKKQMRKAERRRQRNLAHLTRMKDAIRLFKKKIEELRRESTTEINKIRGDLENELRKVVSIISHTASKGVIHKNEARRRISRITKLYNKFVLSKLQAGTQSKEEAVQTTAES